MLKMHFRAGRAATALLTAAAVAQPSAAPATTPPAAPMTQSSSSGSSGSAGMTTAGGGQLMAQMPQDMMRGSKLMGIDVYGSDNQKIGDIDEVIVDRQGKIHAVVIGVGGFLGIGQKDVAVPYDQLQWMTNQEVQAQNNQGSGNNSATTTASGTNNAGSMTTSSGANQPATTGSTGGTTGMAGGAPGSTGTGTANSGLAAGGGASGGTSDNNMPARAMVKMTKADLQNAPEFRYSANDPNRAGAAGNTNPPPQNVNTPGNTPANAPRQ